MMNKLSFASVRASAGRQVARILLTLSLVGRATGGALSVCYRTSVSFLDNRVFPKVVAYAVHPYIILATMLLLAPLIIDSQDTHLSLLLGNYTNVVSASVSSVVLMQGLKQHRENKRLHAENKRLHTTHAKAIAELHAKIDALTGVITATAPPPPPPTQRRPKRTPSLVIPAQNTDGSAS